jgi:hypothetical protein
MGNPTSFGICAYPHDRISPTSEQINREERAMMTDIEKRIAVLEDIEAIKKLKATYCYLVDAGVAGDTSKLDELMTFFAEDATADFDFLGVHEGKEAVTAFYKEVVPAAISYSAHMATNPIIEVEGNQAVGSWYFLVPATGKAENKAVWIQGRYKEEYIKIDGEWKWKTLTARFDHITPFEEGWAKTPMAAF